MGFHPVENALIIIVCLHSVLATSLCGQPLVPTALAGMTNNVTIKSSGLNRNFLISLPSAYNANTPVPLIFSFHGRGKDARYQQKLSQFSNASYNPNAIAVYPNGFMVS
jgi:poly(3-hydroxybutyrate) depolymerase